MDKSLIQCEVANQCTGAPVTLAPWKSALPTDYSPSLHLMEVFRQGSTRGPGHGEGPGRPSSKYLGFSSSLISSTANFQMLCSESLVGYLDILANTEDFGEKPPIWTLLYHMQYDLSPLLNLTTKVAQ